MAHPSLIKHSLLAIAMISMAGCASQSPDTHATPLPTFLLMGEVHDNPDGHQRRFEDIKALVLQGWRPAIAMEQFDRERQADLTQAMATCKAAPCVIEKAGGARWEWPLYYPVIDLALQYKLPLLAANVSRKDAGEVIRNGFAAALPADIIKTYNIPATVSDVLVEGQKQAINAGHCGHAPQAMLGGFANAQITRDLWMAKTMLDNSKNGVILLAGNGHVRNDLGAVYWLRSQGQTSIRSVAYVEAGNQADNATFDIVHLVKAHTRPDPCGSLIPAAK